MPYTIVSFHAHPDDEALLTAGTLARAAAEGHRVVLVAATDGALGLVSSEVAAAGDLAARRRAELEASAAAIGADAVRFLGYADSGLDGGAGDRCDAGAGDRRDAGAGDRRDGDTSSHDAGPVPFAHADTEEAAGALARILEEFRADALTIYDPAGGYGHPDHVAVHRVGLRAAEMAGTPVVLEATVDRRALLRALRFLSRSGILGRLGVDRSEWSPQRFATAFADPNRLTHRVDVRRYAGAKRAAMSAHASQASGDASVRTLAVFVRLPLLLFGRVFGHEWFVEIGRPPGPSPLDDVFTSLRTGPARPGRQQFGDGRR